MKISELGKYYYYKLLVIWYNKTRKRFKKYKLYFQNHEIYTHDYASFLLGYREIFLDNIYYFKAETPAPVIIDCGANMGMSVIYFKQLYPDAKITAFEADPTIFSVLKENIESYALKDVTLYNKAVWNSDDEILEFNSEGGAGGRVGNGHERERKTSIPSVRLRNFISQPIDFLKIDIEGAEQIVIEDCADLLENVKLLFIEYHSFENQSQQLQSLLSTITKAGFRYYIKEESNSSNPFISRTLTCGMDMQLNIFCYR